MKHSGIPLHLVTIKSFVLDRSIHGKQRMRYINCLESSRETAGSQMYPESGPGGQMHPESGPGGRMHQRVGQHFFCPPLTYETTRAKYTQQSNGLVDRKPSQVLKVPWARKPVFKSGFESNETEIRVGILGAGL